jgi:hypothetical protein
MTAAPGLSEDRADLFAALQRLPREQRQALVLHYFADRAVVQIAEEIGAHEGTVKARLHRAAVGSGCHGPRDHLAENRCKLWRTLPRHSRIRAHGDASRRARRQCGAEVRSPNWC